MRLFALCLALLSHTAAAHEFWIEPLAYQVDPDGRLQGHLVNGEHFEGRKFPYLSGTFRHFIVIRGSEVRAVQGRNGSLPALDVAPSGPGLNVVIYQSNMARVTYEQFEEFASFAEHKDFPDIETRHNELDYPQNNFAEVYTRYAKTLIAVGDGAGADRREGLETEIVALTNPYTEDLGGGMRVQVFYQNAPRANAQVEVFEKAPDGTVETSRHRADPEGIAAIPVKAGYSYLFDAVVLRQPAPNVAAKQDAAWETLWASLTFAVPEE